MADAYANGKKCVTIKAGEAVVFTADIETPPGAGKVTAAAWDYEKTNDFSELIPFETEEEGRIAHVKTTHIFAKPGTYFPVLKVQSSRTGTLKDIFVQCRNLDRVRVIVE